jgi:hypothetical protein
MRRRAGWIAIDKRTWPRHLNKMSWRNSEQQIDFGRAEDPCNLDAPKGKTLILENAILHEPAERLQRKGAYEPNQRLLLTPL